jgi:hypothetical protein
MLKLGDRVRFVKAHHTMNRILRSHEGEMGRVRSRSATDNKLLVKFDRTDPNWGQWWIADHRLELLEDDESKRSN